MKAQALAVCTAVLVGLSVGVAAQSGPPIDCSKAKEDLTHLRHEKLSTLERMTKGVSAIMPIGLVVHTLTGTETQTMEMATGEYNKKIDERIVEIVHKCGVK